MIKLTKEMQETKEKVNELCDRMARVKKAYDYFYDNNRDEWCHKIKIIGEECIEEAADLAQFCNTFNEFVFHAIAVNKLINCSRVSPYNLYENKSRAIRTLYCWKSLLFDRYLSKKYFDYNSKNYFNEVELEELEPEND